MRKERNTFLYSSKHNKTSVYIHRKSEFFYLLWMRVSVYRVVFLLLLLLLFWFMSYASIWAGHGSLPSAIFNNINGLFSTRGWRLLPDLILYAGCKLKQNPLGFCRSNVLWIQMQSAIVCSHIIMSTASSIYGKHETFKIIFRSANAVYI